jgi:hypothetical protein
MMAAVMREDNVFSSGVVASHWRFFAANPWISPTEDLAHLGDDRLQVAQILQVFQHQYKFVTPQARGKICMAQSPFQASGHIHQETITNGVSMDIINGLEIIEIEHPHGQQSLMARCPGAGVAQTPGKAESIGQTGEAIVVGLPSMRLSFSRQLLTAMIFIQGNMDIAHQLI